MIRTCLVVIFENCFKKQFLKIVFKNSFLKNEKQSIRWKTMKIFFYCYKKKWFLRTEKTLKNKNITPFPNKIFVFSVFKNKK